MYDFSVVIDTYAGQDGPMAPAMVRTLEDD